MRILFSKEKETLNTVRYREEAPADGKSAAVVTQYIQKAWLREEFGTIPDTVYLTIEAV
jgi:hypothetical protein